MVQHEQPQSYVWPADYNWMKSQHHDEVSTVSHVNLPVSSTEILVPWLLSIWMMGNKTSTSEYPQPKSTRKYNRHSRNENELRDHFTWGQIDLEYPNQESKQVALKTGAFIPINNSPLGLEIWKTKMFLSLPQWKPGIPATLTYVNLNSDFKSPVLKPYPSWNWYTNNSNHCHNLMSVFRMEVDKCDRLWVLDSGAINLATKVDQKCPVKLDIFDLKTDTLIRRFLIPKDQTSKASLFTNIVVEIINGDCEDAHAYMSDVFQYGLVVYSFKKNESRRINHPYFYPNPLHCRYNVDGITFNWMDGIFGMCLSPDAGDGGGGGDDRLLYFHAMSSNDEFYVPTASLRNASLNTGDLIEHFVAFDRPRCGRRQACQSSAMAMGANGVMYYGLVSRGEVGCWNTGRPFGPGTQGTLRRHSGPVSFPNDLKVDKEPAQRIWMLSNGLHKYLYGKLNPAEVNYRVMKARADRVVRGTVCE